MTKEYSEAVNMWKVKSYMRGYCSIVSLGFLVLLIM